MSQSPKAWTYYRARKAQHLHTLRGLCLDAASGAAFAACAGDFVGLRTLTLVAPGAALAPAPGWGAGHDLGEPGAAWGMAPGSSAGWAVGPASSVGAGGCSAGGASGGGARQRSPLRTTPGSPAQVRQGLEHK